MAQHLDLVSIKYQQGYVTATRKAAATGDSVHDCVLPNGCHAFLTGQQLKYARDRNFIAESQEIK